MCGIAGAWSADGALPTKEQLDRAIDRLRVRGPDDSGSWSDSQVLLGHRRLAIVDLSAAGHQPMVSADGRFVVTYNGEIYNHLELRRELTPTGGWRGGSDTETLLEAFRAWGADCVQRFNGMFAFGIWDRESRRLFLARDRIGVKPLYLGQTSRTFAFASRPAALACLLGPQSTELSPDGVRAFLELGFLPAPLTLHAGMRKLPPAHCAWIDSDGVREFRYWDYRHITVDESLANRPEAELADELEQHLQRAVKLRLMSDVPLGTFLSGGVDSALIAAMMRSAGVHRPKAFTIGFDDSRFDETPIAARIAEHLGVEHVVETLSVSSLLELLPEYVRSFDEPLADAAAFPNLALARLARRHVTVALSGDGGDELFGGYHHYGLTQRLLPFVSMRSGIRAPLGRLAALLPDHRAKLLAGALQQHDVTSLFHYLRSISKDFEPLLPRTLLQSTRPSLDLFAQSAASFAMDLDPAEIGMRLDLALLLPDAYLQKVDVSTMAFSLEGRCPFTDYRLVEWAMKLPLGMKRRDGQTKYLLKKVLERHLPADLVHQPKRGFAVPIADWLRGPLRSWAQELLGDQTLMARLPIDPSGVRDLFRLHLSGARNAQAVLWAVLMLLCYVSEHLQRQEMPTVRAARSAA